MPDHAAPPGTLMWTCITERAAAIERLRAKLAGPTFRAIEGFPIGEDEAIPALSDPPTYTACPNPFLPKIVARWQEGRGNDALGRKAERCYNRLT